MSPRNRLYWFVGDQWVALDTPLVAEPVPHQAPIAPPVRRPVDPWLVGGSVGDFIAAAVYEKSAGGR